MHDRDCQATRQNGWGTVLLPWCVPPCSGLVIAMVVSLIFIVLLRFLAGIMVWVMIVLVILVIGYGKLQSSRGYPLFFFFFLNEELNMYECSFTKRHRPLLHGVCESEGRAGLWRHHPWPGPADGLLRLPADQTDLAGLQYAHLRSSAHLCVKCLWTLL